jgi:PAS domain S-box-containing protein
LIDFPLRVLIVDDDEDDALLTRSAVTAAVTSPPRVDVAASASAAESALRDERYDLVLVDYRLGADDGLELLRRLRASDVRTAIVMVTGQGDQHVAVEAMKAGATDYLVKGPALAHRLGALLRHAREIERSRVEREEAEASLRLRTRALEAISHGLLITNATQPDNPVIYVNPGFERITGYPPAEVLGRNCRFLQGPETAPDAVARVREAIAGGRAITLELLNYRRDGTPFWNLLSITPVPDERGRVTHFVGIVNDVTAPRMLADQMEKSERLQAVGRLAGGIAHDFNNTLGVILGHGELALRKLPPDAPARRHVEEIEQAAQRAATSTRHLLAYGQRQILSPEILDPNLVVGSVVPMLKRVLGEDVELETALGVVSPIRADVGQLERALTTLALRAREAMPHGGRLRIETGQCRLEEADPRREPNVPPGTFVSLRVADDGPPIAPDRLAHVFEPFYFGTTDRLEAGLGLAMVHGLVHQSGGQVLATSAPGAGTTFELLLPCVEAGAAGGGLGTKAQAPAARTVLVLEDEAALRDLVCEVLEDLGYVVLSAASGLEALEVARAHGSRIDLLVTDVVLTGISGSETARRMAALHSGLHTLFMSGYTDDVVLRAGVAAGENHFLAKPFTAEALARKVEEALSA